MRIGLGLLALVILLSGLAVHASTNVSITVTCTTCTPVGGDIKICSDAAGLICPTSFTATSLPDGTLGFFAMPGCAIGPYTVTVSQPNSSIIADTATINVVAGPLVRLIVTKGKNLTVPIKGGTTSIAVAGGDACNNVVPLP